MKLTLIRHTSVKVPQGMIYGHTDVELNNTFPEEVEILSQNIEKYYDIVYSSPLLRCKKLAQIISDQVITDNRLKELNFGSWEGKFWKDIDQSPEAQRWFQEYITTPCPAGESYQELLNRIQAFFKEILQSHKGQNICIVTHGGPIRAFISILEKVSPEQALERTINYGQVVRYQI